MNKTFWVRFWDFPSANLKSKIENLKWLGLSVCAFVLVAAVAAVQAQQPKKVARIGYLSNTDPAIASSWAERFRLALRERGYIEGENIAIEYRNGEGRRGRSPELAAELVRHRVDIIVVAGGELLIQAAKNATKTTPIVMMGGGTDPVTAGLVESLVRPGGNVTGLTLLSTELGGKRLELLKEVVPKLARVAVLYDPGNTRSALDVKHGLPVAAGALRLTLHLWDIRGTNDFDRAFAEMSKQRPDGLYVLPHLPMLLNQERIVGFALKSRFPSIYFYPEAVDVGGLMFYGVDLAVTFRRIATYVDRILKGARPADLPVEQPKTFEFVINLKTAKQIGLTIPPNVLARADRVIR